VAVKISSGAGRRQRDVEQRAERIAVGDLRRRRPSTCVRALQPLQEAEQAIELVAQRRHDGGNLVGSHRHGRRQRDEDGGQENRTGEDDERRRKAMRHAATHQAVGDRPEDQAEHDARRDRQGDGAGDGERRRRHDDEDPEHGVTKHRVVIADIEVAAFLFFGLGFGARKEPQKIATHDEIDPSTTPGEEILVRGHSRGEGTPHRQRCSRCGGGLCGQRGLSLRSTRSSRAMTPSG
jgi:hypothetical protein